MRKRSLLRLGLLACLVVGAAGFLWLMRPSNRINEAKLQEIQLGMTLPEVEEILGGPPWKETDVIMTPQERLNLEWYRFSLAGTNNNFHQELYLGGRLEFWLGETGAIVIILDHKEQKVCDKRFTTLLPRDDSFFDTLRRWLHLP
jgi:hypothetical protein